MSKDEQLFWKFGRDFPKGTILFHEGDPGREMFIIQKGRVRVRKKVEAGEKILAELGDGEFFGEMALLEGLNRSATVEVIENSKILVINPETFETLLKGNPEIAVKMLKKISSRLRRSDEHLEAALLQSQKKEGA